MVQPTEIVFMQFTLTGTNVVGILHDNTLSSSPAGPALFPPVLYSISKFVANGIRAPCAFGHTLSPVEPRRALRSKNNRRAMLNAAKRLSEPEPTRAIARGVTCPRCAGRSGVVRTMQPGQLWRKLAEFRSSLTEPPQRGDGGG